jgi:MFS family permease
MHPPPATLVTRHFALVFAITFITFFAAFQLFPTVPLRLIQLGASVGQSGWFMGVFTVGSASGALFTGPLGDRIGQRRMIVGSTLIFTSILFVYGLIQGRWWWFCVLALPHGIVWSGLLTATMATLGGVLPEDRRADGLTLYGLASPGGVIFGPILGLTLFEHWGFAPIAFSLAATFLLLALFALTLPPDRPTRERRSPFQMPERIMVAPCSVLLATALGYGVLGTYTTQEALRLGSAAPWAFLTFMAVGMVGMRILMTVSGFDAQPVNQLPRMLWMACAGLLILAFAPTGLPRHILSALLYGAGYSMVHTLINTYVLEVVHPERRGAAFGATLFSFDAGISVGSLVIGGLIGWADRRYGVIGFRLGWTLSACMALAAVPLAYRLVNKVNRTP